MIIVDSTLSHSSLQKKLSHQTFKVTKDFILLLQIVNTLSQDQNLSLCDMDKATSQEKWQAKVSVTLKKAKPDQIWPLFTDFFNLHKWLPTLATCHGIHGINGQPGCIRFCSGSSIRSNGVESAPGWSKEKLVVVDHVERVIRYEIVETNIGFESYVSTVRILPRGEGCLIEWAFTVDPVKGWSLDDLVKSYEKALGIITNNMEEEALGKRESC